MKEVDIKTLRKKLSPLQLKFADSFILGLNEQEAVRDAGYKMASDDNWRRDAYRIAKKNMQNDDVRAYIKALREKMASDFLTDELYVTEWLKKFVTDEDFPPAQRVKAVELIGKSKGMFVDKTETKDTTIDDPRELMRKKWEQRQKRQQGLKLVKAGDESERDARSGN